MSFSFSSLLKYFLQITAIRRLIAHYCTLLTCAFFLLHTTGAAQQTLEDSILHDGIHRSYILYVPEIYDDADHVPLVFNFHGYTSNAKDQMAYGDFRPIADTANFIVVHPQGTRDSQNNNHFAVGWGPDQADDVSFTNDLLDTLVSNYSIDENRIYSTGMSNGGFMSYRLACELSERIAAVASVTGSMSPTTFAECNPTHPMPVLEIHGTFDLVVPFTGSGFGRSIPDVVTYWTLFNNCGSSPIEINLPDLNTSDGSTVVHQIYSQCDLGIRVELMRVDLGGHTWPGTIVQFPGTNRDINAADEVWKFFSRYDIGGPISKTSIINKRKQSLRIYPNPASDEITLNLPFEAGQDVQILDISGRIIQSEIMTSSTLRIGELPKGIYFLRSADRIGKFVKT